MNNDLDNVSTNLWITANAGSGKTTQLVNRYLLLLKSGIKPSEIVCITYTEAGANEMKNRIIAVLNPNNEDGKIQPWQLKISTIHGFCQRIMTHCELMPKDINILTGDVDTMDKIKAKISKSMNNITNERLRKSIQRTISVLAGTKSITEFYQLIEIIIDNQNSFLQCFIKLCKGQDVVDVRKILDNINIDDIELLLPKEVRCFLQQDKMLLAQQQRLQEEINITDKNIAYELAKKATKNNKTIIQNIVKDDGYLSKIDDWADIVLTTSGKPRASLDNLKSPLLHDLADYFLLKKNVIAVKQSLAVLNLAYVVLHNFQQIKNEMNVVSYDDILFQMLCFLNAKKILKAKLNIKHLMLDEAQDTNPISWKIIEKVVEETKCFFFVVGDPKQSIYRFQGAKVEEYERNKQIFQQLAKQHGQSFNGSVELNVSYRSTETILNFVDKLCNESENKPAFTADYNKKIQHKVCEKNATSNANFNTQEAIVVERIETYKEDDDNGNNKEVKDEDLWIYHTQQALLKQELQKKCAMEIADKIAEIANNDDEKDNSKLETNEKDKMKNKLSNSIAVIFPTKSVFLYDVISALKKHHNVNVVLKPEMLKKSIYVRDVIAFFKFVVLQNDNYNLAGLLKSPLFGLDDDILQIICCSGKKIDKNNTLWQKMQRQIITDIEKNKKVVNAVNILKKFPPMFSITQIIAEVKDVINNFIANADNEVLIRDYKLALQLVEFCVKKYSEQYELDLRGFLQAFKNDDLKDDDLNLSFNDTDGVKKNVFFSTIHGVKGMEFDTIILLDLAKQQSYHSDNDRMMFLHDGFFFKTSKKDEPSGEQFANLLKEIHLQEDTQKLENLRLLYVAITRAKRRFIYFYDEDKNYYLPIIQKIEK